MFVTAGEDRRVLLIKLADRMHNIETLRYLKAEQQDRIARETMDIYAPLADRLGMNDWKWRLEDKAFYFLDHKEYRTISGLRQAKATRTRGIHEPSRQNPPRRSNQSEQYRGIHHRARQTPLQHRPKEETDMKSWDAHSTRSMI